MSTCCPYRHISYASSPYLTFDRLFATSSHHAFSPPISLRAPTNNNGLRQLSNSSQTQAGSARHGRRDDVPQKHLQESLDLGNGTEVADPRRNSGQQLQPELLSVNDREQVSHVSEHASLEDEGQDHTEERGKGTTLVRDKSNKAEAFKQPRKRRPWSPYDAQGKEDLNSLASSLQGAFRLPKDSIHDDKEAASQHKISRRLPVSPLVQAFERGKARKSLPKGADEEHLANNPWATMLASPVRLCSATGVRLPADLLVPWGLVKNPATAELYLMPTELAELGSLKDKRRPTKSSPPVLTKRATIAKVTCSNQERGSPAFSVNADSDSGTEEMQGDPVTNDNQNSHAVLATRLDEKPLVTEPSKRSTLIYMLPFFPLLHYLTLRFTSLQNDMVSRLSRPGAIKSILSWRVKASVERARFYAGQRTKAPSSSITREAATPSCPSSLQHVKWEVDMEIVMLRVLRERVLAALEMLGNRNQKLWRQERELVRAKWVTRTVDASTGKAAWKSLGSDRQTEYLTERHEAPSTNEVVMCLLVEFDHANPPESQYRTDESENELEESQDAEPFAATNGNWSSSLNLEPSTIKIDKSRSVPLFSLNDLLDAEHISRFRQLSTTIGVLAPRQSSAGNGDGNAYVLVVPARAFGGKVLVEEIWRLWRFLGGKHP